MTDFYQHFLMLRLSKTLNSRVILDPTLHGNKVAPICLRPIPVCVGFLRDVATSRQRKQAFFAFECCNDIDI